MGGMCLVVGSQGVEKIPRDVGVGIGRMDREYADDIDRT